MPKSPHLTHGWKPATEVERAFYREKMRRARLKPKNCYAVHSSRLDTLDNPAHKAWLDWAMKMREQLVQEVEAYTGCSLEEGAARYGFIRRTARYPVILF